MKTTRTPWLACAALVLAACQDEGGAGGESGGATGGPSCDYACIDDEEPICSTTLWNCDCFDPQFDWGASWLCPACSASPPTSWCKISICDVGGMQSPFTDSRVQERPCYVGPSDEGVDDTSGACESWDPASEVSLISRVYYMDETFVDGLVADPTPLTECDDTRFDEITSPVVGFKIQDSDTDELLYELGLRDNDIPLTLNSLPLETYADALDAFSVLYLTQGETSYVLEVKRGLNTIEFEYELE